MPGETIPEDVREFVYKHIDSIAELEALLLLRRENSTIWNSANVAERLYISQDAASDVLGRLHAGGLLTRDGTAYHYECATPELSSLVDTTADFYAHQLIPMTHLIHSKASRIREFADAFKLRKDP